MARRYSERVVSFSRAEIKRGGELDVATLRGLAQGRTLVRPAERFSRDTPARAEDRMAALINL
jgi:hypothetical protein